MSASHDPEPTAALPADAAHRWNPADANYALHETLDHVAMNDEQGRLVFNPSPEVDSIAERVIELRRLEKTGEPVPHGFATAMLQDVKALYGSVEAEANGLRGLAGMFDEIRREQTRRVEAALDVKSIARAVRPHLKALKVNPDDFSAIHELHRVARRAGPARMNGSLRGEIGSIQHALLVRVLAGGSVQFSCTTPGCDLLGVAELDMTCPGCGQTRDETRAVS